MFFRMKKSSVLLLVCSVILFQTCSALSGAAREKGFVFLHEVDPTILVSLRYATSENFVGAPVDGYKKTGVIVLTKQAAQALKKVQEVVKKDGYSLVVYDAYRPQKAVDHFVRWGKDVKDQVKKANYYPRVKKNECFKLGYIVARSGHSRGSTVDLTLIKCGNLLHDIKEEKRTLQDGFVIKFLNDGTVDMGSSFDLFDGASHTDNTLVEKKYQELRAYLKTVMCAYGFKAYSGEWWHFTLKNEPYPATENSSYFDFDIE